MKPNAWFKGNKAKYTGNTHDAYGVTWYEILMLEGVDKGKTKVIKHPPEFWKKAS